MSRKVPPLCALCFARVVHDGPSVLVLHIVEPKCAVTLRWCITCAGIDPLNAQLAEAEGQEPIAEADDDPLANAYDAILDRALARGANVLRGVVDVRRDLNDPRRTMRGAGLLWGRPSVRVR